MVRSSRAGSRGLLRELDDRRIETLANAFARPPIAADCFLIPFHGAVTRAPVSATPFPLRKEAVAFDGIAYWTPIDGQGAATEWIGALKSNLPPDEDANYVNNMERVSPDSVRRAYGSNYARLQALKALYDPHNLFFLNQNIQPA